MATRRLLACLAATGAAALGAGCGSDSADLDVTVAEWSLDTAPARTSSGTISMNVDNDGGVDHELVLVPAPADGALPTLPTGAVDLEQVPSVDRLDAFGPGRFEASFLRILPGDYILFCNLVTDGVAHYAKGVWTEIAVEATERDRPAE